jgi:S-formylglutathione hydrolase
MRRSQTLLVVAVAQAVTLTAAAQNAPPRAAPQAPAFAPVTTPAKLAGKLERITVHGDSLVGNLSGDSADRQVTVYLPPSYASEPRRRYPVLYLLHGYTDSDDRWFGFAGPHFVNVPGATDRAYAAGVRELIIVMPNAFTKFQGSMYSTSAATGDWEAFVAKDLVGYIDDHYRTLANRASRGLAGHSMGGYGTIRIGMKYPQTFSSLYSMSPCCMAANLMPSAEQFAALTGVTTDAEIAALSFPAKAMLASAAAWSADPKKPPLYLDLPFADGKLDPDVVARWAANAPLAMVYQYLPNLRKYSAIALDAGDQDQPIESTVRRLDRILTDYGIAHTAETYEGNHVSGIHERLASKVLPFFAAHLAFE